MKHTTDQNLRPKVGIGVMVLRDGKVLLSRRKVSHGGGSYESVGGHLEYMESFEACAKRETREECGIEIKNIHFLFLMNLKEYAPKHYVHVQLVADWASGEPKALEPAKNEDWTWYDLDHLPQPIFETDKVAIEAYRTGQNYFDN